MDPYQKRREKILQRVDELIQEHKEDKALREFICRLHKDDEEKKERMLQAYDLLRDEHKPMKALELATDQVVGILHPQWEAAYRLGEAWDDGDFTYTPIKPEDGN